MELNRDVIIKALECCTSPDGDDTCLLCPYGDDGLCAQLVMAHALVLIKQLTEDAEWSAKRILEADKKTAKLTEENERLMSECGNQSILWRQHFESVYETAKETVKADTIREMQERLDKHFCHDPAFLGVEQRLIIDVIDQIAKEMLEGENDGD